MSTTSSSVYFIGSFLIADGSVRFRGHIESLRPLGRVGMVKTVEIHIVVE